MPNPSESESDTLMNDKQPSTQTFSVAPQAKSVRTFMVGLATEDGPKLLAFAVANLLIGRMPDNHLGLNHGSVSRRHARIAVTNKGVIIEDLGSQNGTTINGKPVKGETALRPGDVVRIGYVPLFYFGFIRTDNPPAVEFVDGSLTLNPSAPPI